MRPDNYIIDEFKKQVDFAKARLSGDCPLIEDEVIIEMSKYIKYLEQKVWDLEYEVSHAK